MVWTADAPSGGDTAGTAIKARLIAEDGTEVVAEFLVNVRTNGLQCAPGVTLEGAIWTARGTVTDTEGTFNVLTDGNARIEVAQAVGITRGPLPMVELSDVEGGIGGFVINGVSAGDLSGYSVSAAGDVNGDGFDDLIVGALRDDPNGNSSSGASFVVFGETTVIDFASSEGDQLDASAFAFADFIALQAAMSPDGPGGHGTRIAMDGDTDVVLIGVENGDLVVSDFIL